MQFLRRVSAVCALFGAAAYAQKTDGAAAAQDAPVFRSETKQVLVDAVVTDKKGSYVHDLTQKDFKVWEDGKEQEIKSFGFQADPASPWNQQKHYLVLFFDNSTIDFGQQAQARKAAISFLETNAGPNRFVAVMNFGGSIQVTQNFTDDVDRLKKVVNGVKFSNVTANPDVGIGNAGIGSTSIPGMPNLSQTELDFAARDLAMALRTTARNLASVPGRKILVLLTGGFPTDPEITNELTATIDACNKANVAVYPIDVRGLVTPFGRLQRAELPLLASLDPQFAAAAFGLIGPLGFQHGGGGSVGGGGGHVGSGGGTATPGGGSHSGGSTGGGRSGGSTNGSRGTGSTGGGVRGGTNYSQGLYNNALRNQLATQNLLPKPFMDATANQQMMYMLANGTGGFVIVNTNDLLAGLNKIGKEQNEFYLLGYTPEDSPEGSCHSLKVKVNRGGTSVRYRTGYCNVKPVDYLSGTVSEKELEAKVKASGPGNVKGAMQAPYFYDSPNVARVNVALDFPADALKFEKEKGKLHSTVSVLGIAYKPDGSVAARFSDSLPFTLENKKDLEEFQSKPLHYENQFDIASGQYTLKVIFDCGGNQFGKLETPLNIEPYDGKQFMLSGVAMSKDLHPISDPNAAQDAMLIENRVPLIASNMQITPSGSDHFTKSDRAVLYTEIYDSSLTREKPPAVGLSLKVINAKTGEVRQNTGFMNVSQDVKAGNPVVPVGIRLLVSDYGPGQYRAEIQAMDTDKRVTGTRTVAFSVD